MLIRYAYGEDGFFFYKHISNIIPRIGETIIFHTYADGFYDNCNKEWKTDENGIIHLYDEYVIDNIDADVFVVTDVCYMIGEEEPYITVTVDDARLIEHDDYLENLAKDVNIPNDYR